MFDFAAGVAIQFVTAEVAKGLLSEIGKSLWDKVVIRFKALNGRLPEPEEIDSDVTSDLVSDPKLREFAEFYFGNSAVLRRAGAVRQIFIGARALWIDDHPEWNVTERHLLESLGCKIVCVESTRSAIASLSVEDFDFIVSDIAREGSSSAGIAALPRVQAVAVGTPIIFYVGSVVGPTPSGAFGITAVPQDLLHFCIDVLERRKL